jgi:hypothetical protein
MEPPFFAFSVRRLLGADTDVLDANLVIWRFVSRFRR